MHKRQRSHQNGTIYSLTGTILLLWIHNKKKLKSTSENCFNWNLFYIFVFLCKLFMENDGEKNTAGRWKRLKGIVLHWVHLLIEFLTVLSTVSNEMNWSVYSYFIGCEETMNSIYLLNLVICATFTTEHGRWSLMRPVI